MLLYSMIGCAMLNPGLPPETLVVVRGDTLFELGKKHGVTVQEIMEWNELDSDRIEVGQTLILLRTPVESSPGPQTRNRPRPSRRHNGAPAPVAGLHGPQVPTLPRPPPKKCLVGPNGAGLGDEGAVASQGLSYAEAKGAMDAFLPNVGTCLVDLDPVPSQALELSISVGCDGRVSAVGINAPGDWPAQHRNCLVKAIHRAPFPAHALPDGDTFLYPLRMR